MSKQEMFDLDTLKEGDQFTEEIYIEDLSGKETLVAMSTFKVPKVSPAMSRSAKKAVPILMKTEYFSDDFQPMARTGAVSAQEGNHLEKLKEIWKIIKPIGDWIQENFRVKKDILDLEGNRIDTPMAGMLAHHAKDHDYHSLKTISSEKLSIKVKNVVHGTALDIKGLAMVGTVVKTDKAKEKISESKTGLPGQYLKTVSITYDTCRIGGRNYCNGQVSIEGQGNANNSTDYVDASVTMVVSLSYGTVLWGWDQSQKIRFTMTASNKDIPVDQTID